MQAPLYVRPLTMEERATLEGGVRSASGFTVRRAQMLLASADGQTTITIAQTLRCNDQTVRNVIHAFHARGLAALYPQSSRPRTVQPIFDARREQLRALLHQSPRTFGKPTSIWTLQLAAEVSFAEGITPQHLSGQTVRQALKALGVAWKRAKHSLTNPDPDYARKKRRRDRLIRLATDHPTWALGFADEVWWSRLAQMDQHGWVDDTDQLQLEELRRAKDDPDPKSAGLLRAAAAEASPTHRSVAAALCGRPPGQRRDDGLSGLVQRAAGRAGRQRAAADLG